MNQLHKALEGAKSASGHTDRPFVNPFKGPQEIQQKPADWDKMTTQAKVCWLKIHGPISRLPVSVEIVQLHQAAKVEILRKNLWKSGVYDETKLLRITVSPKEFVSLQRRVSANSIRYSERVRSRKHILLNEIDDETDDLDNDSDSTEQSNLEQRRLYGTLKKIRESQLERLICVVQVLEPKGRNKSTPHFSTTLTYGSLLVFLGDFKSIDEQDINKMEVGLRDTWHDVVSKSKPLTAKRFSYDFEILSYVETH